MRNLLIAMAMLMSTSTPVAASDNTDVITVVHRWTDAFSQRSFNTDIAPCAEDAVVIDDLPPHVWQGPGACSKWFKAFEAWASKAGVTNASSRSERFVTSISMGALRTSWLQSRSHTLRRANRLTSSACLR